MRKPLVYIDIDNTIIPFQQAWIAKTFEGVEDFDAVDLLRRWRTWDPTLSLKKDEADALFKTLENGELRNIYANLKPYPEMEDLIKRLALFCDVTFITACPETYIQERYQWGKQYFPGIPIITTDNKIHHLLESDIFIDDKLLYIMSSPAKYNFMPKWYYNHYPAIEDNLFLNSEVRKEFTERVYQKAVQCVV